MQKHHIKIYKEKYKLIPSPIFGIRQCKSARFCAQHDYLVGVTKKITKYTKKKMQRRQELPDICHEYRQNIGNHTTSVYNCSLNNFTVKQIF